MRLHIYPCLELKTPPAVARVVENIMQESDPLKLASILNHFNPDREIDQIDIGHWIRAIDKFDKLLAKYSGTVLDSNVDVDKEAYACAKEVISSILLFLARLIQTAKDKKYFQSFEVMMQTNPFVAAISILRVYECIYNLLLSYRIQMPHTMSHEP
jgi:hypothetical protein